MILYNRLGSMLRDIIVKLGHFRVVLFITLSSVLVSILVYFFIVLSLGKSVTFAGLLTSFITPSIVAPAISWYLTKFIFEIMDLEMKMRSLATKDGLTGLPIRQSFLDSIESIYELAKRNKSTFTILYMDVDNFKSINDTYGHTTGDMVLKSLGKVLKNNKRDSDLVGRIGGEEFAYALSDIDLEGSMFFAEKIRKLVENDLFNNNGVYIKYTMSIGISIYDEENNVNLDKLISQADRALYEAKADGKNCVKVFTKELE